MAISLGKSSISLEDILSRVNEIDILSFYLGVNEIPCIINSPLREDKRPSFGLYSLDGSKIYYIDFATKEKGGTFDLLSKMWNISYSEVLERVNDDLPKFTNNFIVNSLSHNSKSVKTIKEDKINSELQCKVRDWRDYDIKYWESYGINLEWLKYAEVYPISHKIIIKNGHRYVFKADKYAYAYVEHKEGKVTLKIYQPFNKNGYKWSNKHDSSVISLWTKVPEFGDKICICSSLKDALCLWANTGIPCINPQGEGYEMSNTAISELKRRYKEVFILFDNDEAGLMDGEKLSASTGFTNVVLPKFEGGKDISDLYKELNNKEKFIEIISKLFNYEQKTSL